MEKVDKKESLKTALSTIAGFSDKISKLKESLASMLSETQGGAVEDLTAEQKAELEATEAAKKAKDKEDMEAAEKAKAAELAEAEAAKKLAKPKSQSDDVADINATVKATKKDDDKDQSDLRSVAASKDNLKEVQSINDPNRIKPEVVEDAKAALELAVSEAAKIAGLKATEETWSKLKKAMSSEDAKSLGLDESEAALATKHSFAELVKLVASLTKENEDLKAIANKAEASKVADSRYRELVDLGVAFIGKKAEMQKDLLVSQDEKAFASYKESLLTVKETVESGEGFTKSAIEKARASLGSLSVAADLEIKSSRDKYKQF